LFNWRYIGLNTRIHSFIQSVASSLAGGSAAAALQQRRDTTCSPARVAPQRGCVGRHLVNRNDMLFSGFDSYALLFLLLLLYRNYAPGVVHKTLSHRRGLVAIITCFMFAGSGSPEIRQPPPPYSAALNDCESTHSTCRVPGRHCADLPSPPLVERAARARRLCVATLPGRSTCRLYVASESAQCRMVPCAEMCRHNCYEG